MSRESSTRRQCLPPLMYDMNSLSWDIMHLSNKEKIYCYCGGPGQWYKNMLQCQRCQQWFHEACLSCLHYPLLYGDRFYIFICSICNEGTEFLHRLDMKWVDVVHLALYNLVCIKSLSQFELDSTIAQWINDNWENLQLPSGLQNRKKHEQKDEVVHELEANKFRFRCGRELKKKNSLWSLRKPYHPPAPVITLPVSGVINSDSIKHILLQYKESRLGDSAYSKQKSSPSPLMEQKKKGKKQGKEEKEEGTKKIKRSNETDDLVEDEMPEMSWVKFHKEGEDCSCSGCIEIEDFIHEVEEEAADQLKSLLGNDEAIESRPMKPKSSRQKRTLSAAQPSNHSRKSRSLISDNNSVNESHILKRSRSNNNGLSLRDPSTSETWTDDASGMGATRLLISDQSLNNTSRPTVPDLVSGLNNRLQHKVSSIAQPVYSQKRPGVKQQQHKGPKRCRYCRVTFRKTCGLKSHLKYCKWARIGLAKPKKLADSSEKIATSVPVQDQPLKGKENSATVQDTDSELKSGLQARPNLCIYCHRTFKTLPALISHNKSCKRANTGHIKPRKNMGSSVENVTSLHKPDQSVKSAENTAALPGTLSPPGRLLDKPIKCSYCSGTFKSMSGLKCHIKTCKWAKANNINSENNTDTSLKMETSLPVPNQAMKNTDRRECLPGTLAELGSRTHNENLLHCNHCSATFEKIQSLKCHIKTCKLAKTGYTDPKKKTDSFVKFEANLPTSDQLMESTENGTTFPDTLDSRLLNCQPFQCTYCGSTFKTGKLLVSHANSCSKTKFVPTKMVLTKLKKKSDNGKIAGKEESQIDTSLITMSLKEDTTAIVDRPLRCPYCRKTYETQNSLDVHISTHVEEKPVQVEPYSCTFCKATFLKVRSLRSHIMTHTGEKPFKCNYCSSSFRSKSQRILHHRIHTGEKPFKCSMCDAAFARSGSLTIHIRIHSGDKPYQCSECPLSFARKDRLNAHMHKHT